MKKGKIYMQMAVRINRKIVENEESENRIQQDIVMWYNNNYCLSHHTPQCLIAAVPNGGNVSVQNRMTLLATGMMPGFSDLIVIHEKSGPGYNPAQIFFIEVKAPGGVHSPQQDIFAGRITMLGFKYKTVRSLQEFKDFINGI